MPLPRPAPGRAKVWIVATIGFILLTVGSVWWGLAATVGKPNWMDVAWDVTDDHAVVVKYQVSKPPDQTVRCLLEAQGHDHSVVGSAEVDLGPSREREHLYEATLRTTTKAVRAGVRNCRTL